MTPVTRVPYIRGGHFYVSTADLQDGRKRYLPIYMPDGRKWTETRSGRRAERLGRATTLHRDNIADLT